MLMGFGSDKRLMAENQVPDQVLNIIVFGDSQVGKTSLLEEYCSFRNDDTTIDRTPGVELHVKKLRRRNSLVTAVFYDFGGDIQHRQPLEFFLKHIISQSIDNFGEFPFAAVMTVFDCGSHHTIYQMKAWLKWFFNACLDINSKLKRDLILDSFEKKLGDLPLIVLGNKIDSFNAEPFLNFELGRQPRDQRDNLTALSDTICKKLRAHLCITDCDNIVFTSAECNPIKLSEVIDRVVCAIHDKYTNAIMREEFDICGMTISRAIKGKIFQEELLKTDWIAKIIGIFAQKTTPELPL
jgi:GTPase SAR1 family protein